MVLLRKLLFPFAILYWCVTTVRNYFYDWGWFPSYSFPIPVIVVGNLSVGGTGKTPMTEYLIRLLSQQYRLATLSRGYKRQTSGFILADASASAKTLGDEPFQIHRKFPGVQVAVDADRKNGIAQLLAQDDKPQVILLDDAFQHRRVKAGLYILLTAFDDLFSDDWMLPMGNLREGRNGVRRADVIVVTKCPPDLSIERQNEIVERIDNRKPVFFTSIDYDDRVFSDSANQPLAEISKQPKTIVAGIAKPQPFFDYLKNDGDVLLEFADHHDFSASDLTEIQKKSQQNKIITTEKDFVRLSGRLPQQQLYYLPIRTKFIHSGPEFDQLVLDSCKKVSTDKNAK